MKVAAPAGYRTDMPPLSAEPFWFYGENVRFRMGMPETIGLFIKALSRTTGLPVIFPNPSRQATLFGDATNLVMGDGDTLHILDWATGVRTTSPAPDAGGSGRWWFASTEDAIICGRANFTGKTYAINRVTKAVTLLPNAPDGAVGGGIVAGILLKAGTKGVAGDGPKMVVRWSARQTDPSSGGVAGPYGFEDWVPSDVNSSGEFLLNEGSEIRGAGSTQLGYVIWTDTRMILLAPRNDTYVFTKSVVALRGLLANQTWTESDGRVWWFDQTRTLNVFDGGSARQVINPMHNVSTEMIKDTDLALCFMSSDAENGEIILHYPDKDGFFRELVYNYMEDAWYAFALNRIAMTDAHGDRPTVGMDATGQVFFYDIREGLIPKIVVPKLPTGMAPPVPFKDPRVFPAGAVPEAFSFFLMTNWIASADATLESFQSRNLVLPHTASYAPDRQPMTDMLVVTTQSYGQLDLNETPVIDTQSKPVGKMLRNLRAGGKAIQYIFSARDITTHLRFAPFDVEADARGKR